MLVEIKTPNELCFMEEFFYKHFGHKGQLCTMEGRVVFCIVNFFEQIIVLEI